jgi:hypothetical protein
MADQKISQLTAKGTAIASTDLIEISESNGAGGYVTKSVTGANVVSGLQPTLVSGTNIKTINSNTLLGSGDLVIAAGGGGVHVLTKPVSGRTYNARTTGTNGGGNFNPSGNTITLYPFIPANTLTVSNLQANVVTAIASGLIRILVYSDLNGVPNSKLIESTNLDCSTSGVKTYTESYTFTAGTVYWLGYYANMTLNAMSSVPGVELTPISALTGGFSAASITVTAPATFPTAPATLGSATPVISAGLLINLTAA